jgi:nuclear pore complex protein Nup210
MPRAKLTVSEAAKITINLLPYFNWVTVEHENHEIGIDLFTKNDEKITLGSYYRIESSFDRDLFAESKRTVNGSRIAGMTKSKGTSLVTATFEKLQANAEMIIHRKIDLVPKLVVIPYDVNKPVNQRVQFIASGGDGSFSYFSGNPGLVTMTADGYAETHLERFKEGGVLETSVKAALTRNTKIFKSAKLLFLPPVKLEIVAFHFETAVNDFVDIHVGLFANYNDKLTPYTNCENLHFDTEFSNQIFTETNENEINAEKNACRVIRLKGMHSGLTSLTVSYRHGNDVLKDDVQLLVYEKLITLNPNKNEVVLPIGSSRNVIYQYGPRRTQAIGSELKKVVEYSKNLIDVNEINADFQDQRFGLNVLCKKIGETKIHLEIFNFLNQDNFVKNSAIIETTVYCVKPRFINLNSIDNSKTSCPIDRKSSLLHVRSMHDALDINIEVLDAHKRKLDNITSLIIDWKFLQTNGILNNNIIFNRDTEIDEIDGVSIPSRDYIRTSISEVSVNHKIKAVVSDYDVNVLKKYQIQPESPQFGIQKSGESQLITPLIENELDFLAFDASLLPFSSVAVFLSPGVVRRVKLGHGSGYYDIKVKHSTLLDVQHDKTSNELILKPKQIGETILEISDRCLKIESSQLSVSIVGIGKVELSSSDRVEKTKSIEAIVKLFDTNDKLLDIDHENLNIYRLNEKVYHEQILSIKKAKSQENLKLGEIRYVVTGNELGETKVVVSSGTVSSSPVNIQVFPPLQLIPRNATILVGSHLEITSKGGPKSSNVVYSVANNEIITIDGSIVEGLKVGKSKVVGKSMGVNPVDGKSLVFTEDFIFVTVIPLNRIKIKAPLNRLKSGSIMPITLWADNEISPMILGTLKNLRIQWQTDATDVIELKDVFDELGVVYGKFYLFILS